MARGNGSLAHLTPQDQESSYRYASIDSCSSSHDKNNEDPILTETTTQQHQNNNDGSTWLGASFNLASSIVGAGCIGLGGAIAQSGGLISAVAILFFAVLSKYSFDLVVSLAIQVSSSLQLQQRNDGEEMAVSSYESLGKATYGRAGEMTVIVAKGVYSYGCLVAYMVIVKDNFAFALSHLLYGGQQKTEDGLERWSWISSLLVDPTIVTILLCTTIMLPLSLMRDLAPLAKFSLFKIAVVLLIVVIVISLYFMTPTSAEGGSSESEIIVEHWLTIHHGVIESMGTFVFTFVAQHSIHLVFESLRPRSRTMLEFQKTTVLGTFLATMISLSMGIFVYMTFWEETSSDMFSMYGPSTAVNICRILLCISMLLTYPFPFLTVRELIVLRLWAFKSKMRQSEGEKVLLPENDPLLSNKRTTGRSWFLPGEQRQLRQPFHLVLTLILWGSSLALAISVSSLGAVLNLTGCAAGTVIAYILPALFSMKLRGHTFFGSLLLVLGGVVGSIGTFYSLSGG